MVNLKKIARGIGILIFVSTLSTALLINSLSDFTKYENMKSVFVDMLSLQLEQRVSESGQEIDSEQLYQVLSISCEGKDSLELPLEDIGQFGDVKTIPIDCNELRKAGSEGVINYLFDNIAKSVFDSFYYKDYSCEFVDCIQKGDLLVVMSAEGHYFFDSIKLAVWAIVIIGAILIFAYSESWSSRLKGLGWPLIFTGLSYFFISFIKSYLIDSFSVVLEARQAGMDVTKPIDAILNPAMNILLLILVAGIVLTVAGYVVRQYEEKKEEEKSKIKVIKLKK